MRRTFIVLIGWLGVWAFWGAHAAGVKAIRVWPAPEYSRIALEFDGEVRFKYFTLNKPERMVLDLEGVDAGVVQTAIADKVASHDDYIANMRAARNCPGVTRLVVELKDVVVP